MTTVFLRKVFFSFVYLTMMVASILTISLLGSTSVVAQQYQDNSQCRDAANLDPFSQLLNPSFELIPEACAAPGGKTAALPLAYLPYVLVRGYGVLSVAAIYLCAFSLIFGGLIYSASSFMGERFAQRALELVTKTFWAMVFVLLAYLIVYTIGSAAGLDDIQNIELENNDAFTNTY
jgi:hypothetical protein